MSNYENINRKEYGVKYPKKEKAYAFIPHDGVPFESAVVGITYPSADYEINRSPDTKICLFEYVLSGEGEVFIDGNWQTVTAGGFYILPSGCAHSYRSNKDAPWEKIWINYVSGYMPFLLKSYGIKSGIYRSEKARIYFEELAEIAKESNLSDETAFNIADRLHKIVRIAATRTKEQSDDEYGMRRIVSTYLYRKFSLDEFAEKMSMSKSNCIRLYKKKYGVTPYDDLIGMKIEAAKTFLKETNLPIKEIANKLCIYDEHYFSSLFLSKTGKRPGNFRKSTVRNDKI